MRLVLLLVFFIPIFLFSQDIKRYDPKIDTLFILEIYVFDSGKDNPLMNCEITLIGNDGSHHIKFTDSLGKVIFEDNGAFRYINKETTYHYTIKRRDIPSMFKGSISTVGENRSKRFIIEEFVSTCCVDPGIDLPIVLFSSKSSKLANINSFGHSKDSLDIMCQLIIDNPTVTFEVQGYSDCTEKDDNNKISYKRAEACVDYLISKGISKERLTAKGYGVEKTGEYKYSCETISKLPTKEEQEKAHQMNRRVQFVVLSFDYKPTDK